MRRRLYTIVATLVAVLAVASVGLASAGSRESAAPTGKSAKPKVFVGYWMGVDPVDGGDSRRGFTRNADGTIATIGRDTVLTLCDGTDRGVANFSDGIIAGSTMTTDNLVLTCFDNDASVTLRARYDVINANLILETTTTSTGEPVSEIFFHRVSERN
jgi:hypothetical protein